MGDAKSGPVRLSFNPQLRVEFRGATVTSDAGLLLPRELDERLGERPDRAAPHRSPVRGIALSLAAPCSTNHSAELRRCSSPTF